MIELINGHPVILLQTQMGIVWPETHFILIDKHVIAINFFLTNRCGDTSEYFKRKYKFKEYTDKLRDERSVN